MNKNTLKYLIDVTIFIDLCSISIIGFLLGFIIPEGKGVNKYFLSLHRHQWGDIHLYLSLFFIFLIIAHIWLNWAWVKNSSIRYFGDNWKNVLRMFSIAWFIVLFIGWIAVKLS